MIFLKEVDFAPDFNESKQSDNDTSLFTLKIKKMSQLLKQLSNFKCNIVFKLNLSSERFAPQSLACSN